MVGLEGFDSVPANIAARLKSEPPLNPVHPKRREPSGHGRVFKPQALPLNPSGAAAFHQRHDFFPANMIEVAVDGVLQA